MVEKCLFSLIILKSEYFFRGEFKSSVEIENLILTLGWDQNKEVSFFFF